MFDNVKKDLDVFFFFVISKLFVNIIKMLLCKSFIINGFFN